MINSRDINDLKPYVKYLAQKLIDEAAKQGLKVLITSTLRDDEYQAYLYSQGRTRAGKIVTNLKQVGAHGFGLAFDVCQNIKRKEYDSVFMDKVGKIGISIGLEWGGSWKIFVDKPHFQYAQGLTNTQLRAGMLPKFPPVPNLKEIKKMNWKEILNKVSDNPDQWQKAIDAVVNLTKTDSNFGDLEILKFLPQLIEKIYNK